MKWSRAAVLGLILATGCDAAPGTNGEPNDGGVVDDAGGCAFPQKDSDGDGISDADEGAPAVTDTDGDGTPDYLDADADGDGISDAIEGRVAAPCAAPVDSDGDGTPDFRDRDSDSPLDATVPDAEERGAAEGEVVDSDGDGSPDYLDDDDDGDGISDTIEMTPQGGATPAISRATAPDTDKDGVPDYLETDADADSLSDHFESALDTDEDGTPNYRDLDSDGDCIGDAAEGTVDTDNDGAPDALDVDADDDGLTDDKEDPNCNGVVDACETDATVGDTDADGVGDLIEATACAVKPIEQQMALKCRCDGQDPAVNPRTRGDFVFIVDYEKTPVPEQETLALGTDVSQADVIFALDTTGSMQSSLNKLASTLANTIIPSAQAKVPNLAVGVVDFKDVTETYVVDYKHRIQTVKTPAGVSSVQNVLQSLKAQGGGDGPEAGWEALYSIAGGPLINLPKYWSELPLATTFPQPPTPGEVQGTLYGAGFRPGSVPIVVTVTDAEWHDAPDSVPVGEDGLNPYGGFYLGAPSRKLALERLNAIGAYVMGLVGIGNGAFGDPKKRALATAQATGAVVKPADFGPPGVRPPSCVPGACCTGNGGVNEADTPFGSGQCPLAFTYDGLSGNGVGEAVVSGIVALSNGLQFDIHVEAQDVDAGAIDNFILKLSPNLSGVGPAAMCVTMPPKPLEDKYSGPKALPGADGAPDTFPGGVDSKQICFDVTPKKNTKVPNQTVPQVFRARLQVKGEAGGNTVDLGTPREVFFLVPPVIANGPIP